MMDHRDYDQIAVSIQAQLKERFPWALVWYVPTFAAFHDGEPLSVVFPRWDMLKARIATTLMLGDPEGVDDPNQYLAIHAGHQQFRSDNFYADMLQGLFVIVCFNVVNGEKLWATVRVSEEAIRNSDDWVNMIGYRMAESFTHTMVRGTDNQSAKG